MEIPYLLLLTMLLEKIVLFLGIGDNDIKHEYMPPSLSIILLFMLVLIHVVSVHAQTT